MSYCLYVYILFLHEVVDEIFNTTVALSFVQSKSIPTKIFYKSFK